MAFIPIHHSGRGEGVCITSRRVTQLMAFVVLISLVVGTNAYGRFESDGGECGDEDLQSSGNELDVYAKASLDSESTRNPFDHYRHSNFHHMSRHNRQHAGMQNVDGGGRSSSATYVHDFDERPHYIRGSESGNRRGCAKRGGSGRRSQLLESNNTADTSSPQQEVEALISFKAAISADPSGSLRTWRENDSTPCNWTGVFCSMNSSDNINFGENHVVSVNLTGSQLVGDTDSALRALRSLQLLERVDLSNNSLTGSMSGWAFANWSGLLSLNMSANQITGVIPREVGELINLQILDFKTNNLTGEIPPSIFNCTALQILNLGANFLSGTFPELVGRLSRLELLNLGNNSPTLLSYRPTISGNSFIGTVPASLGNCTSLKVLRLTANPYLGGEILPLLAQLKNLEDISIAYCNFMGSIPGEFGNLSSLRDLQLSYNRFDGHIPTEIGNVRSLRSLRINDNNFSGVIPASIVNCTDMTIITIQNNEMLTGEIPADIGLLRNLETITAWSNRLTGVIPASMGNCSALQYIGILDIPSMDPQPLPSWLGSLANLEYLWLNNANLYGSIPKSLGRLSKLQQLSIYGNNLTGPLPAELGNCTSLTLAQLGGNQLTGNLPAEIGRLSKLQIFSVGNGLMSGPLPASLSNLTLIETFEVRNNFFTGTIGDHWGGFSQLTELAFERNNFVGSVPAMIGNSSRIQRIDFSSNNLTGDIPPSLGSLPELQALILSDNHLRGTIPLELASASKLVTLDLSRNSLEGSVPSNIGALSALEYLYLGWNKLGGAVPESLANCSSLITLDLSHNQFEGRLPANILSKIGTLTFLNLSRNQFSGAWPPQMSSLGKIQELNVSGNSLSGPFSISGGAAAENSNAGPLLNEESTLWLLVKLDISNNDFTGNIPESLGSLPALRFFNASYNAFQGPIPESGIFKSNVTAASFLGNPLLCGDVLGPGRGCPASSGESKSCAGFRCERVWIPLLCGAVVLVVSIVLVLTISLWAKLTRKNRETKSVQDASLIFHMDNEFSAKDVLRIIHQSGDTVLGMGSKSVVYMGAFKENKIYAVKVLSQSVYGLGDGGKQGSRNSRDEVLNEVHVMAKLRHRNILRVVGYCSDQGTQALILEYMPGGSLHKHLHASGDRNCRLSWHMRLNVALGIAEGMKYLHHDFPEPLIHGDLKPSNVLLDSTFVPKVADFGLSRFVSPHREDQASVSRICGTIGYIPPEYALGTVLSTKGDVYSFGIVLLELLTGRSPASDSDIDFDPNTEYRSWILENYYSNPVSLLDSTLREETMTENRTSEQMRLMLLVGLLCTREMPQSRPTMNDVLVMLIQISEIRLIPTEKKSVEELAKIPPDDACRKLWSNEDPNGAESPMVSTGPRP